MEGVPPNIRLIMGLSGPDYRTANTLLTTHAAIVAGMEEAGRLNLQAIVDIRRKAALSGMYIWRGHRWFAQWLLAKIAAAAVGA